MFSNAQKLAAVLNKWSQPAIQGCESAFHRLGQPNVEHFQRDSSRTERIVLIID